jgi:hypothetical protein
MSGPTAVVITAEPVTVLLAAAAVRAAKAVYGGYRDAAALKEAHRAQRDAMRAEALTAAQESQAALEQAAVAAENRLDRLAQSAERLEIEGYRTRCPLRPESGDAAVLAAYVRGLQGLGDELEAILRTEAACRRKDFDEGLVVLSPSLAAQTVEAASPVSRRLLARIAHLPDWPEELKTLAQELDATPSGDRATLLANELRRRIQLYAESVQQREVQEATALVVEQTLEDLGYQVEPLADTLFVEGGVVHFRRRGWGDYLVRMRVNAKEASANFNVVRAVAAGSNELSALDHLAEDRWCAEFPALLKALEARGVFLGVTRRLAAGEVPVQRVDAGRLPRFAEEEEVRARIQAMARGLE